MMMLAMMMTGSVMAMVGVDVWQMLLWPVWLGHGHASLFVSPVEIPSFDGKRACLAMTVWCIASTRYRL